MYHTLGLFLFLYTGSLMKSFPYQRQILRATCVCIYAGFAPVHHGPVAPTYTVGSPTPAVYSSQPLDYQQQQALALAYQQQLQQYQHYQHQHQPAFAGV
jgi:hypothetical protein